MSSEEDTAAFQRAFLAMRYFFDQRGDALIAPLPAPVPIARELARGFGHPERAARAQLLAREIARIAGSLEARRLA
jgi:hypothetical protein